MITNTEEAMIKAGESGSLYSRAMIMVETMPGSNARIVAATAV